MDGQPNVEVSSDDSLPDVLHIPLSGRLDTARCATIADAVLANIRQAGKPVVFDLEQVDFVASSFLRICILAAQAVGAGHVSLHHASPSIKRVFKIAGLDDYIVVK